MVTDLAVGTNDVGDTQIDVRRKTPVELDLPLTDSFALLTRREIDEVEPHRLLELVHAVAHHHDQRDEGLAHLGRTGLGLGHDARRFPRTRPPQLPP